MTTEQVFGLSPNAVIAYAAIAQVVLALAHPETPDSKADRYFGEPQVPKVVKNRLAA